MKTMKLSCPLLALLLGSFTFGSHPAAQAQDSNSIIAAVVWTGDTAPTEPECAMVAAVANSTEALEAFAVAYPDCGWAPGARKVLGTHYRESGLATLGLTNWSFAWCRLKDMTNDAAKSVANYALASQAELLSSLGRVSELHTVLQAAEAREFLEHNDRRRIETAREAYQMMVSHPALSFRCGSLALANIARQQEQPDETIAALIEEPSTTIGISLARLVELNASHGLGLVAVKRTNSEAVPVPAVVHWSQSHYGALLEYDSAIDFYKVVDPTFGEPRWISASNLNAEASGYFMVPTNQVHGSWSLATTQDCAAVWGRGFPYGINDRQDKGCKIDPTTPNQQCVPCQGMPQWWVSEPYMNVWFADEPWSYATSRDEQVPFRVTVKQREAITNNFGYPRPGVLHNWYSRIYIRGMPTTAPATSAFSDWSATLYLGTGGERSYTKSSMYDADSKSYLRFSYGDLADGTQYIVPGFPKGDASTVPPATGWNDSVSGFRVFYPDGTVDRYGFIYWRTNASAGFYECEALWTSRIDPLGNETTLTYACATGCSGNPQNRQYRLSTVRDSDGNITTFSHDGAQRLQQVSSPFAQTAVITYDIFGNLGTITDAMSLTSTFTWSSGRVTKLVTPYGTNTFDHFEIPLTEPFPTGGHNKINRAVTVTDASGGKHLYAYRFDCSDIMGPAFDSADVPQSTPTSTLDTGTNTAGVNYAATSFRNTFHWNPRQYATLSTTVITNLTANDYTNARMQHWLGDANNVAVSDFVSVTREPSPDGTTEGQKTFYDYPGKSLKYLQGSGQQAGLVSRRQPSGATEYQWTRYNSDGFVTNHVSTYALADGVARARTNIFVYRSNTYLLYYKAFPNPFSPVGSPNQACSSAPYATNESVPLVGAYSYSSSSDSYAATSRVVFANLLIAATNADLTSQRYGLFVDANRSWEVSCSERYEFERRQLSPIPSKVTNEVGQITTYTYNNLSRRLTGVEYPSGLTLDLNYNGAGYLTSIREVETRRTNSFTYADGLVLTHQDEYGRRSTNLWDKLQRLTRQSDAEGYISNRYDRLHLGGQRDKLGRWTEFGSDALVRRIAVTNAAQEVSLASYCACGSLDSLRDPLGNFTYYNYDRAGRLTNVLHPDDYSVTNTFNALDQLVASSDGLGSVAHLYNLQGLLTRATGASGLLQTNVFDVRDRPLAVTDARSVVARLTYDNVNRPLTQSVDGGATNTLVWAADGLSRVTDALGNVTGYNNDELGRPLTVTNANLELTQLAYNFTGLTNLFDGKTNRTRFQSDRFGRLTNKVNAAGVSILRLTYDANGFVQTRTTPEKGTTTFIRDLVGRVRTNSYANDVPVVFTYDANGRLESMADTNGLTTFTYTPAGQLSSEDGPWAGDVVTNIYTARRRTALGLSSWQASYGYDADGRLSSVTSGAGAFGYNYSGAGDLIRKLTLPGGAFITNTFDGAGRMLSTRLLNSSATTLNAHAYTYDAANRRTSVTRADGSIVTNSYDKIGQLKLATAKESGGTSRLNEQFSYGYDKAGNLTHRTNNALVLAFTTDTRNQLSNATRSGTLTFGGANAQTPDGVTVNGMSAARYNDKTFAATGFTLSNGTNTFTTVVTYGGNSFTNITAPYLPDTVAFQYDTNGNLLSDGARGFTYDDEDRLTRITLTNFWKTEFVYDGLGRKRITRESAWNGSSWTTQGETRYVYNGLLVLQERDANNNVLVTYTRGTDLSGTMQGAGGIGGLLARTDSKGSVFYHADGNGNVTALVDAAQTLEARYLYDSFGNLLGQWGPLADANHYRFSSKEWHAVSGLYDYGRRFYQPNLQRWMNVDPIGEAGGINLHEFVYNSPLNFVDPFGLDSYTAYTMPVRNAPYPGARGYTDPFGNWSPTFCLSCHGNTPTSDFYKQQSVLANMLDYKVLAYEQLLGAGLTLGFGSIARNMENATYLRNLPQMNRACGLAAETRVQQQLLAEGNTLLGAHVGARTSDGLRFIDRLVQTPSGQMLAVEVKSGDAVRNAQQLLRDQLMATQGATLVGRNAPPVLRGQQFIIQTIERR